MMKIVTSVCCLVLVACSGTHANVRTATSADPEHTMMLAEETRGRWVSITCELRPTPYQEGQPITPFHLTRDFTYNDDLFEGTIVSYADPLCEVPLVSYTFSGHLVSHGPSPAAPGAEKTDYVLDRSLILEPLNQAFTDQLNQLPAGSCGLERWQVGRAQSIRETGCPALNLEKGQVYVDHDIQYVDGDFLFFGAKPVDGSNFDSEAKRPVQLQVPLKRAE